MKPIQFEPFGEVRLGRQTALELLEHARRAYPDECCGALLGRPGTGRVERILALANTTGGAPSRSFTVGPADMLHASSHARGLGFDIVGFYHSHPDGDARPSLSDIADAPPWPEYLHVIIGVQRGGTYEMRAYRSDGTSWHPQPLNGVNRMVTVRIPLPLRRYTGGQAEVTAAGGTIAELLGDLVQTHGELSAQLFDGTGGLRRFINVFINDEDIRLHQGLATAAKPGDRLDILPAIAGGVNYPEWRASLQSSVEHVGCDRLDELMRGGQAPALVDVRTSDEWAQGYIPGAKHLDRGFLEIHAETELPDKARTVVVYCESGTRSLFAAQALKTLGYAQVFGLRGGLREWKASGRALAQPRVLTAAQRQRYLRHIAIPEVGPEGQGALLAARILCVGVGGLGCPAALYLAAAGVGTLGLLDSDVVDLSNLQRQVLHTSDRVGQPKTASAKQAIAALNPDVQVVEHGERLCSANALAILGGYDVIIDGTDNFATRYLINDACAKLGKPFVHGSVYRFDGRVGVFWPGKASCYRCLYPEAPPPELAPSCAEAGVLGVLPGVIGVLQATEAIKLVLGLGEPLVGRTISYDALGGRFRELRHAADPHCAACGSAAGSGTLADLEYACAMPAAGEV